MSHIKHKFFIICLSVALAVALFTGVFAVMGWGSFLTDVGSAIIYPFQWGASVVGDAFTGVFSYLADVDRLQDEVDSLKAENESLRADLVDAEIMADENAWLYRYLAMKEDNGDYAMCAASVVSTYTGAGTVYATELTLNKGSLSGVAEGMPVVTVSGLIGVVVEVGLNHSRVATLLDTSVSVGAVTTRATENGLCKGDYAKVHNGQAVLRYLPEEADVETGDIVVTSGQGSVYPYGIPIGRVTEISANAYSRTTEATIQPFVDFSDLHQVIILTEYTRGEDIPSEGGAP